LAELLMANASGDRNDECAVRTSVENYARANGATIPATDCRTAPGTVVVAYFINGAGNRIAGQIGANRGIPGEAAGVQVTVNNSFRTLFLGILNENTGAVAARATARYGNLLNPDNLMPLTVFSRTLTSSNNPRPDECTLEPGHICKLFGDKVGPGNFQWLDFEQKNSGHCANPNVPKLEALLAIPPTGDSGHVSAGDWICGTPGTKIGSLKNELEAWLDVVAEKRLWTIPIYDTTVEEGNNFRYHIIGFAEFRLSDVAYNGNPKYIMGEFVRWTKHGKNDGNRNCLFGTCGVNMID
jgi:hypothetical protein